MNRQSHDFDGGGGGPRGWEGGEGGEVITMGARVERGGDEEMRKA